MFTIFDHGLNQLLILVLLFLLIFIIIYSSKLFSSSENYSFLSRHVVVTGGSSGIGKSIAVLAAQRGANVTIIARDANKLASAKDEISKACSSSTQRINSISLDVSCDPELVEKSLLEAEDESGPIFMLVNCAGSAVCGKLEDTSVSDLKFMMDLNYFGTVYPTKAVVTRMKERGKGHIVITASQAAMVGIFGFTAYSASKFALRGFAEALDMEVRPYGVKVTVCLPPDTDTPGLAAENKNKPIETQLISESSGLLSPDLVAKQLLDDVHAGKFYSTVGFEGFMLTTVCAGMSPVSSILELTSQVFLMGPLRLVTAGYLLSFQNIIKKCMKTKDHSQK